MYFQAFVVFLAVSSVSGLAVPQSQAAFNPDVEDSIKTTWVGEKATTVYPGATPPEPWVPSPSPPFTDVSSSPFISRSPFQWPIAPHLIARGKREEGDKNRN